MNSKGFSLLEIILAIAALSMTSIFILQMFLASANVNQRAKNVDYAMAEAVTAIESIKKQSDLENYLSKIGVTLPADTQEVMPIYAYFDKDWRRLSSNQSEAEYCLRIDMTVDDAGSGLWGRLYTLAVTVTDFERELVKVQAKKYFPGCDKVE